MSNDIERKLFERKFSVPDGIYWNELSEQYDALPGTAGFDEVEIYHGQWMAWQAARSQGGDVQPVAWSWVFNGRHVTVDKAFADQLIADSENVRPLVFGDIHGAPKGCTVPEEIKRYTLGRREIAYMEERTSEPCMVESPTGEYVKEDDLSTASSQRCSECGPVDDGTALYCVKCWDQTDYDECRAPKGWKLVPVKPTGKMLGELRHWHDGYHNGTLVDRYHRMLSAAPQLHQQEG